MNDGNERAPAADCIVLTLLNAVLLALVVASVLLVRPKFVAVFADLGAKLPALTQVMISLPVWLVLLAAATAFVVLALMDAMAWHREARSANLLVLGGLLLFLALEAVAFFLPLTRMVHTVGAP